MKKLLLSIAYMIIGKYAPESGVEAVDNVDRVIDKSQPFYNRKAFGKTGFKGIYKLASGRYTSTLNLNDADEVIQIYIGTFDTAEEASDKRIKFIESLK